MTDKGLNRLAVGGVIAVALFAAVVSAIHIYVLSLYYGQIKLAAVLMPASVDGTVVACNAVMLRAIRRRLDVPGVARLGMWSGVFATLACNVGYGITRDLGASLAHLIPGSVMAGWPSYAFIVCTEAALLMARRVARATAPARTAPPVAAPAAPPAKPPEPAAAAPQIRLAPLGPDHPAVKAYRASVEAGAPLSERRLAVGHLDGNRRAAKRAIQVASNGHAPARP